MCSSKTPDRRETGYTFMNCIVRLLFVTLIFFPTNAIYADQFSANASYTVCFTPGDDCTHAITKTINQAKQSILIQAYTFTSYPIENALIKAKNNGVNVKIIMDKNQYSQFPKPILYLAKKKIPVWIDYSINGLAHNKIIIIDNKTVITGSFNFTKAAQNDNAENILIITDEKLAEKYAKNWQRRFQQSCDFSQSKCKTHLYKVSTAI